MPTIFLFSGQGSQYYQMGRAFFETEPLFRRAMMRLDAVFGDLTGQSLLHQLFDTHNPSLPFDDLLFTHPAIVRIECALTEMFMEENIVPQATVGCSLGSFAAAAASGWISSDEAVTLAVHQAQAVEMLCEPGVMIAILAPRIEHEAPLTARGATIAADNFENHFIVSARSIDFENIEGYLNLHKLAHQKLPVRHAFHTHWLGTARQMFLRQMPPLRQRTAKCRLWCCASEGQIDSMASSYFWDVVEQPIQFASTICRLERQGPWRYLDLGPSATLATFLKYSLRIGSRSHAMSLMNRGGRDTDRLSAVRAVYEGSFNC
jgi:acyl transferase domain-containing protein